MWAEPVWRGCRDRTPGQVFSLCSPCGVASDPSVKGVNGKNKTKTPDSIHDCSSEDRPQPSCFRHLLLCPGHASFQLKQWGPHMGWEEDSSKVRKVPVEGRLPLKARAAWGEFPRRISNNSCCHRQRPLAGG